MNDDYHGIIDNGHSGGIVKGSRSNGGCDKGTICEQTGIFV